MTSPQTIAVIGAGTMGSGIAQSCAVAGLAVAMIDVDDAALARGRSALSSSLDRLVKKEKLSAVARDADTVPGVPGPAADGAVAARLRSDLGLHSMAPRPMPPPGANLPSPAARQARFRTQALLKGDL